MNTAGRSLLLGAAMALLASCSDRPTAPPDPASLTLTADLTTNGQVVTVATWLDQPLRVEVRRAGVPVPGVSVSWWSTTGEFFREGGSAGQRATTSLTDAAGIATIRWRSGILPGVDSVSAGIGNPVNQAVVFSATVVAGPAVWLASKAGRGELVVVDPNESRPVAVRATDAWGNGVGGQPVTWRVEPDSLAVITADGTTDKLGESTASLRPRSKGGSGVVVASIPGREQYAEIPFIIAPAPTPIIYLLTDKPEFRSARNGSHPAVDTVAAGTEVSWVLVPFDYEFHAIASFGTPTFAGGSEFEFPYANPSVVTVTFSQQGTYRYTDPATGLVGTIVVR